MSEETEGKKLKEKLFNKKENGWLSVDQEKENMIMKFSDEYIYFLNKGKTERECVTEAIRQAKEQGYVDLEEVIANNGTLKAGDKVYFNNMGKALALFLIGTNNIISSLVSLNDILATNEIIISLCS